MSLASGGRIEWQHGVPDQRVQQQRSHVYVPAHHDTWRPSSARAHAQGALSCAALLLPAGTTLTGQQPLLPQHTTSRLPPQALV